MYVQVTSSRWLTGIFCFWRIRRSTCTIGLENRRNCYGPWDERENIKSAAILHTKDKIPNSQYSRALTEKMYASDQKIFSSSVSIQCNHLISNLIPVSIIVRLYLCTCISILMRFSCFRSFYQQLNWFRGFLLSWSWCRQTFAMEFNVSLSICYQCSSGENIVYFSCFAFVCYFSKSFICGCSAAVYVFE